MNEEWQPVGGFEGVYSVNAQGQIKRIKPGVGAVQGRILKPATNSWGYWAVSLQDGPDKKKTVRIHRAVALAFIPNPEGLREVNHINGDKNDNRAINLEWCTRGENQSHAYKTGLRYSGGEAGPSSKLTWSAVEDIRRRYATGVVRQSDLATEYCVNPITIDRVVHWKTWHTRPPQ